MAGNPRRRMTGHDNRRSNAGPATKPTEGRCLSDALSASAGDGRSGQARFLFDDR